MTNFVLAVIFFSFLFLSLDSNLQSNFSTLNYSILFASGNVYSFNGIVYNLVSFLYDFIQFYHLSLWFSWRFLLHHWLILTQVFISTIQLLFFFSQWHLQLQRKKSFTNVVFLLSVTRKKKKIKNKKNPIFQQTQFRDVL